MECTMRVKLDWLSFSFFQEENHYDNDKESIKAAFAHLCDNLPDGASDFFRNQKWEPGQGRKPYSVSLKNSDNGVSIFANAKLPHALVELSGRGCDLLSTFDDAESLLASIADRVTRIDVACDIACDTDPIEFAEQRIPGRFKASSRVVSESGTTVYVGSKTSNRYARVYRYADPHPRSHLLRVEHVFKGEDAKTMLAYWMENDSDAVSAQCSLMFGWQHGAWVTIPFDDEPLKAHRNERGEAKTIYWLYDTVAPVLARLHKEGKLSIAQFLNEAVMPLLPPSDDDGTGEPV
jgi:hypothetical protein